MQDGTLGVRAVLAVLIFNTLAAEVFITSSLITGFEFWPVTATLGAYALVSIGLTLRQTNRPDILAGFHLRLAGLATVLTAVLSFAALFLGWDERLALAAIGGIVMGALEYLLAYSCQNRVAGV